MATTKMLHKCTALPFHSLNDQKDGNPTLIFKFEGCYHTFATRVKPEQNRSQPHSSLVKMEL
jgi:hypothetical protein